MTRFFSTFEELIEVDLQENGGSNSENGVLKFNSGGSKFFWLKALPQTSQTQTILTCGAGRHSRSSGAVRRGSIALLSAQLMTRWPAVTTLLSQRWDPASRVTLYSRYRPRRVTADPRVLTRQRRVLSLCGPAAGTSVGFPVRVRSGSRWVQGVSSIYLIISISRTYMLINHSLDMTIWHIDGTQTIN